MSRAGAAGLALAGVVLSHGRRNGPGRGGAAHRLAHQSSRADYVELYRRRIACCSALSSATARSARREPYDIVATVTGPRETLRTRRKQRVLGIWVNTASPHFVDPPSYLAVLANRPLDAITGAENRRRLQLGIADTLLPELINNDIGVVSNDPFRAALVRLMRERGLYSEEPNARDISDADAVSRLDRPAGGGADRQLSCRRQAVRRRQPDRADRSAFEILKVGFEQFVVSAARDHGLAYGLATATMALLTGWIASVVFRRD